jgi:prepilin-type N-terminal cleavage/methylation domain-containing protein
MAESALGLTPMAIAIDSNGKSRRRDRRWSGARLLRRISGQSGFTLIELLMVILLAAVIAVAALLTLHGTSRVFYAEEVRMLNQDDARTAINQMARYIRMATSSSANQTTVSDAIATALPQDLEFYCDVDGDGVSERLRYYLEESVLWSQIEEPEWVEEEPPYWSYGEYDTSGVVIENRVRNGTEAVFAFYRYDGGGGLEQFTPSTDVERGQIVSVGITVKVGERPDLVAKDVVLSTDVQIRQRHKGGLQ